MYAYTYINVYARLPVEHCFIERNIQKHYSKNVCLIGLYCYREAISYGQLKENSSLLLVNQPSYHIGHKT